MSKIERKYESDMTEECIVGTWACAKLKSKGKGGEESLHPLISRLLKQKIEEVNVITGQFAKARSWCEQIVQHQF